MNNETQVQKAISNMDQRPKYNNELIVLTVDGVEYKLWGLLKACRDKRQQWQFDEDYIHLLKSQLSSTDPAKVKEAEKALLFLNAFVLAELDGNFHQFADLGVNVSQEFKREMWNSRNATQRDLSSCQPTSFIELTDFINPDSANSIGEVVDTIKSNKRKKRKLNNIKKKKEKLRE